MKTIRARRSLPISNPFRRSAVKAAETALSKIVPGGLIPNREILEAVLNHIISENLPPNPYYSMAEDYAREALRLDISRRQARQHLHMAQAELILAICTDKKGR